MYVHGTIPIANAVVAPYRRICTKYNLSNFIIVEEGFYCIMCHNLQSITRHIYLQAKIIINISTRVVTMHLEGQASI